MRGGAGEAFDRGGQVGVGGGVSGEGSAQLGENLLKIQGVDGADEACGLVAVEDADLTAWAKDAVQLGEAFGVVGKVAEAEGGGDEVEGLVGVGQVEGVGLDEGGVGVGVFLPGVGEHAGGEIEAGDGRVGGGSGTVG